MTVNGRLTEVNKPARAAACARRRVALQGLLHVVVALRLAARLAARQPLAANFVFSFFSIPSGV